MPTQKLTCPQGVLHVRMTEVHQQVTKELFREELGHFGAGNLLCAFERMVDGMYGVEAYVQFSSRWRAARARAALDGRALYEGCCFLSIAVVPPVYNAITTPDEDDLAPAYFYDDTPYAEWAAALAMVERHDGDSTSVAAPASFASTPDPDESPNVQAVCDINVPESAVVPKATTPAVGARTAVHESDDDNIVTSSSQCNSATPLDSTSSPTMSLGLASKIKPVTPTRCSVECLGDATTGEMPTSVPSACSSFPKRLDDATPSAVTVLGHADAEEVIAPRLFVSLTQFPAARSFFVSERGSPATADNIQVTTLSLLSEVVFPTIIMPIAVSVAQYDVRPLPWPSFLNCQHVGDKLYRSPDGAKLGSILLLFTEEAQADGSSLGYIIPCCSETMQWEIAWMLSELSCRCVPWTSWQLNFFVRGSRTASSIYDVLIYLKAQDEIEMRLEPSLQTVLLTLGLEDHTDAILPMIGISKFTHDLLIESECSDIVIDPLQVLNEIHVTTSAVCNDDTLQGILSTMVIQLAVNNDFALRLEQDTGQPPGTHVVFNMLPRSSLSLIIVEECQRSAEKMPHSVMPEKHKTGLSLELHLLVFVVARKETVRWPRFQSTSRDTIHLLPWDPGALMYGLRTNFQVELKQKWTVPLVEQQPWPTCELIILVSIMIRIASVNVHEIVMLEWLIKEGALNLQYHGRLHEKQLFHILKLSELLWQFSNLNSAMVPYIHYRGPPYPDESDCVASKYIVDEMLCFILEEGQPSARVDLLQTHKLRYFLEVHILGAILIRLSTPTSIHAQELYWLLGLYSSYCKLVIEGTSCSGSQLFEWKIPWYLCPCHVNSSGNWLQMQSVGVHWKMHAAFLFGWDRIGTMGSVPVIKHISAVWVLHIPATMQFGSELMPWEIASSMDGISTYPRRLLISWDPSGSVHIPYAATGVNWNSAQLAFSHLIWDPGGYMQHRLEGKPKLKEGGLSATPSILGLDLTVGCHLLGFSPPRSHREKHLQIRKGDDDQRGLDKDGFGLLCFGLPLPLFFLFSL